MMKVFLLFVVFRPVAPRGSLWLDYRSNFKITVSFQFHSRNHSSMAIPVVQGEESCDDPTAQMMTHV